MNFFLAQSHLLYLHSILWYIGNDDNQSEDNAIKKFEILRIANNISDICGLQSDTKALVSILKGIYFKVL